MKAFHLTHHNFIMPLMPMCMCRWWILLTKQSHF